MTNLVLLAGGVIPTNTAAFKAYALTTLLAQANFIASAWKLDVAYPIGTNQITKFTANPTTNGLAGSLGVGDRYGFRVEDGGLFLFRDLNYASRSFVGKDEVCDALARITNLLTLEGALALAREKLHRIGIDERALGLGDPVKLKQWRYDSNGVIYPLPLFEVRWQTTTGDYLAVSVAVSGVTSNVAEMDHNLPPHLLPEALRVPMPTNYYQMLGLPTNVVFLPHDWERRQKLRQQWQGGPKSI